METESRSQPAIRVACEVATNLGLSFERAIVLQHPFVDGFRSVMGIAVGLAIVSAITAAVMIERRQTSRSAI